jgi:hypothetical protein
LTPENLIFVPLANRLAQRGFDAALLSDFVDLIQRLDHRNMTGTVIKIKDIECTPTNPKKQNFDI